MAKSDFIRCEEYRCFANRNEKCTILESACKRKPCPFFQTRSEIRENREKAIGRLIRQENQTALKFYLRLTDKEIEDYAKSNS